MHQRLVVGTIDIKEMRDRFAIATNTHISSQVVNRLILALLNEMRDHIKEARYDDV